MKNIFIFPCGSEIALEIARSLDGDKHFNLIGGCSVKDHGRFIFHNIIEDIPWETSDEFIPKIQSIVKEYNIDCIYPAMDSTIVRLKDAESILGCYVVSSPLETTKICLSKQKTYKILEDVINTPKIHDIDDVPEYPVFCKPDVGYGSRGAAKINNSSELLNHISKNTNTLICEFLSGEEYTVDCFSNRDDKLLFCGARVRGRIMNGISVNTFPVPKDEVIKFRKIAERIQTKILFRGAWFFQVKKDSKGNLVLLEIAARFGGSSALYRGLGVNFAALSLWDSFGCSVDVTANNFDIELDRALDNKFKFDISYNEVFLDYDDTLVMNDGLINAKTMQFIISCINRNIDISILSRHQGDLMFELDKRHLTNFFSRIIHINKDDDKALFIDNLNSIFIDDSYAERSNIIKQLHIPAFGLDMIDSLITSLK